MRHLICVLEAHCERLGRDPAEITKTRLGTIIIAPTQEEADAKLEGLVRMTGMDPERRASVLTGDPDSVAEKASELLESGIDALIFNSPEVHDLETVQLLGETLGPLCSDVPSGRSSVG
jgi:alkanesulfonate monooxygenase SsuD/methylene tetrahydromethanopterin reductase-like flavin-dependent oxidoreductase (luciferase family)